MDVGHRDGGAYDARQVGNVHDLLHTLVSLEIVHEFRVGEDEPLGAHLAAALYAPAKLILPLDRDLCGLHMS